MAFEKGQAAGVRTGQPEPGLPAPPSHTSSQEPSPYDESEVHDSFHQLIREQSQKAAEEGLELQPLGQQARTLRASGEPAGRTLNLLDTPPPGSLARVGVEVGDAGRQRLQALWTSPSAC